MEIKDSIIQQLYQNSVKTPEKEKRRRKAKRPKTILNEFCQMFETTNNQFMCKTAMIGFLKCSRELFLATFKLMYVQGYFKPEHHRHVGVKGKPQRYALSDFYFRDLKPAKRPKIIAWRF